MKVLSFSEETIIKTIFNEKSLIILKIIMDSNGSDHTTIKNSLSFYNIELKKSQIYNYLSALERNNLIERTYLQQNTTRGGYRYIITNPGRAILGSILKFFDVDSDECVMKKSIR
ncbi:MAG: hypothetical protein ACTSU9_17375 [Promethearchaeota archaeon]